MGVLRKLPLPLRWRPFPPLLMLSGLLECDEDWDADPWEPLRLPLLLPLALPLLLPLPLGVWLPVPLGV